MLLVLLAATVISALPYSWLALFLLLVMLFITFRTVLPRFRLAITVLLVFLMPLVVAPSLRYLTSLSTTILGIMAAASMLPVLYLVDDSLRQNAQSISPSLGRETEGRYISAIFISLSILALVMLLLSFVLGNRTLLSTAVVFALYLAGILWRVFLAIPRRPFAVTAVWRRVIAGGTINISHYVTSRASVKLYGLISPVEPWVRAVPQKLVLDEGKVELELSLTPPLAGPSHPGLRVSALDPWGFIQVDQLIEPVALQVIPRARYAEWLARQYLEQAKAGVVEAAALPPRAIIMPKRGIEYNNSRSYQPGDQLRDIDWKHTIKLNQLIIKEYIEAGKQAAIIAVNLAVAGTEAADKLAWSLITAALTLAQEGIPTALAAYNQQRVVLTLALTDPREILKQTLSLVKEISSIEFAHRYLEMPDFGNLRRNIAQLRHVQSEPAQRLLRILDFEYRAIEHAAKSHPAMVALSLLSERTPISATILLVSQLNHDAEAIQLATEKLSRREFAIIPVDASR